MKIFCIGRNYAEHIEELQNERPDQPLIFMKPATALLKEGKAFYIPEFSREIHFECELVIRIAKHGKAIDAQFAPEYIDKITLGIDFTARDIQSRLKQNGQPWEIAKGFDHSACIGEFVNVEKPLDQLEFSLYKNGEMVQEGKTEQMLFTIAELISYLSQFFTLQKGDLIYTGTPAGVGPVQKGDVLEGKLQDEKLLHCEIK